jgi:hypothetical protein
MFSIGYQVTRTTRVSALGKCVTVHCTCTEYVKPYSAYPNSFHEVTHTHSSIHLNCTPVCLPLCIIPLHLVSCIRAFVCSFPSFVCLCVRLSILLFVRSIVRLFDQTIKRSFIRSFDCSSIGTSIPRVSVLDYSFGCLMICCYALNC